jgi:hypothetical protein
MGAFKSKPVRPQRVATDTVVQVHSTDDQPVYKGLVMWQMFRFEEVLDPESLRKSLQTLLEHGNWKKLGARLRRNVSIELPCYLPDNYGNQC